MRTATLSTVAALAAVGALVSGCGASSDDAPKSAGAAVPALAQAADDAPSGTETAILAGGCFWGMEGVFEHVDGVQDVVSGYSGGTAATASYDQVSTGTTGAAESVKITFDPAKISYADLLQIYFSVAHDPTELDRQGPDVGTQYRSTIFPVDADQARTAREYLAQLDADATFDAPVVTTIETQKSFYPAEAVHQDFMRLNPDYPYIVQFDAPKLVALKKDFPQFYRSAA